ncbi:MAG: RICIN domain-containing protein, partial [Streptosporangiaceae bacterium]
MGTWTCNGTGAEQWTRGTDGTVRALGKCLDVHNGGTKNGTPVDLFTCNGSRAQQWATRSGTLYNAQANKCLTIPGASTKPGTALSLLTCGTQKAEQWALPVSANPRAGALVSAETAALCLVDTGGQTKNGTPVEASTCTSSSTQHWTVAPDGTLRVNGRCMDVHNSGTKSGSAVDLYTCN